MKQIFHLGLIPYNEAISRMSDLHSKRLNGEIPDTLLFLEHPPVITMGRRQSHEDLHVSVDFLKQKGIDFIETDRGGKLTYHGPGQLVIYFIVNINERKLSIQKLVWSAEEGLKNLLKDYGISADRDERNPGIWVKNNKIASLGFHVSRGVTTHGLALNINNDMTPFGYFIPCGVSGVGMTSMKSELRKDCDLKEVANRLESHLRNLI